MDTPLDEFLNQILSSVIKLCPGFCGGSVALESENGLWKYRVWKGFPDELGNISFDPPYEVLPNSEEPVVIDNICERAKGKISNDLLEKYRKIGSDRIKKTIAVGLFENRKLVGAIFIDSFENARVTRDMLNILKAYGRISSIFLSMRIYRERENMYERGIIMSMIKMVEMRDPFSVGHSESVARYSVEIARALKIDSYDVDRIYWGSIVHDLGKVAIPEFILNKPGKLTEEEMEIVKLHPLYSESLLKDFNWLKGIRSVVRHHHERWDGLGYPDGLKGEEIPFESRIMSIANAFDAMTKLRPYREPMESDEALREISRNSSSQFDPYIVRKGLEVLKKSRYGGGES